MRQLTYLVVSIVVEQRGLDSAPAGEVARPHRRRLFGLAGLVVLLAVAAVLSLVVGTRALSPAEVWQGLFGDPGTDQRLTEITLIVQTLRIPRTLHDQLSVTSLLAAEGFTTIVGYGLEEHVAIAPLDGAVEYVVGD